MDAIYNRSLDEHRSPTELEWAQIQALDRQAAPLQLELMARAAERERARQAEHRALLARARALLGRSA